MNIQAATKQYEAWLAEHTALVEADLAFKHEQMAADPFSFLRSTFYRWVQVWPEACPELAAAPAVLAVGDLHLENFGTWRDKEGRLVWGVNDFDEAYTMPFTNDLVRLAASACLAIAQNALHIDRAAACAAILDGYRQGLKAGGQPFILAEQHEWLRTVAQRSLDQPVPFWQKMVALPPVKTPVPASALEGLEHLLPAPGLSFEVARRRAGLGSLGHQRFVALAQWEGGNVAREAKALVPSASLWVQPGHAPAEILYQAILSQAVRCRDPFVELRGEWIIRRLAPDCTRIELASLPTESGELRLLDAMGRETANIHLGSLDAIKAIRQALKKLPTNWLESAAKTMTAAVAADWKSWKKRQN